MLNWNRLDVTGFSLSLSPWDRVYSQVPECSFLFSVLHLNISNLERNKWEVWDFSMVFIAIVLCVCACACFMHMPGQRPGEARRGHWIPRTWSCMQLQLPDVGTRSSIWVPIRAASVLNYQPSSQPCKGERLWFSLRNACIWRQTECIVLLFYRLTVPEEMQGSFLEFGCSSVG